MDEAKYFMGFKSQTNEISVDELPVEGEVPGWLSGSLIRTAPSMFEVGKNSYKHWFDGLAMLHKFTFEKNGKISYSCKFLESNSYNLAKKKNRIVVGEFGTDPCRDLFQKVASFIQGPLGTDNGCVNINQIGNDFAATTETPHVVIFDTKSLRTKGHFKFEDDIDGQLTIVHPHYDREGTLYSYLIKLGYKTKYHIYSQKAGRPQRKLIASIPTDEAAYMHSLGMTDNYIILTEFPLVTKSLKLRFGLKPFIENYKWQPERGTVIHLIEKYTGSVRTYKTDAFFCFHHVNAFEEGDDVVFDLVGYPDSSVIDKLYLEPLRSGVIFNATGQLWRFRISGDRVTKTTISGLPIELPRINYLRFNTRPYQYVYGAGNRTPGNFIDQLIKADLNTGRTMTWAHENLYPGEPVFVERPQPQSEDDGVLLSIVLDAERQTSFLLILDAKDLKELARAIVPQHITFGFHGQYYGEKELDGHSIPFAVV